MTGALCTYILIHRACCLLLKLELLLDDEAGGGPDFSIVLETFSLDSSALSSLLSGMASFLLPPRRDFGTVNSSMNWIS